MAELQWCQILCVAPGLDPGTQWRIFQRMDYYVYILASRKRGTLYIGVTNDVARRVWEHRNGFGSEFVAKYGVTRLVYVELHDDIERARQRERTMKEWKRSWKIQLIEKDNPEWTDLYENINR